jgi:hypothetical protein
MNVINKTIKEILESKISPIDVFAFFVFIEAIFITLPVLMVIIVRCK